MASSWEAANGSLPSADLTFVPCKTKAVFKAGGSGYKQKAQREELAVRAGGDQYLKVPEMALSGGTRRGRGEAGQQFGEKEEDSWSSSGD